MGWIKYVDAIGATSFYNMEYVSKIYTDVLYEEVGDRDGGLTSVSLDDVHRIPRATRIQMKSSDGISTLATIPMDTTHDFKVNDIMNRIEDAAKDGYSEIRSDDYLVNPKQLELLVQ